MSAQREAWIWAGVLLGEITSILHPKGVRVSMQYDRSANAVKVMAFCLIQSRPYDYEASFSFRELAFTSNGEVSYMAKVFAENYLHGLRKEVASERERVTI